MDKHFYYYSYGSNLLKERIHLNNPSASFVAAAKLEGYKLDFAFYSNRWKGAAATITESQNDHLWGIVWKLDFADMPHLDKQEDVYSSLEVDVTTADNRHFTCRTYKLLDRTTHDARPSPQYLKVIISGAEQNGLPANYIAKLKRIVHNGYSGTVDVHDRINDQIS